MKVNDTLQEKIDSMEITIKKFQKELNDNPSLKNTSNRELIIKEFTSNIEQHKKAMVIIANAIKSGAM